MDLFGFAKDIGRRLFNKDEEAADNIKEHILANNPGVSDLEVEFERGIVTICGDCESKEAWEKTVLMAGNTKGVVDVFANDLNVPVLAAADGVAEGAAPVEPKVEYYLIKSGDTLSKISKEYYGDAMKYMRIFEANREVIEDPDKIFVGQKIRIPLD